MHSSGLYFLSIFFRGGLCVLVYNLKTSSSTWKECKTFDQQVIFNLNIKKGVFFVFLSRWEALHHYDENLFN